MGYSIERGGWSDSETLALVRMIEVDGRSHSQVARCLGRSRNACIGKYFRLMQDVDDLDRIRRYHGINCERPADSESAPETAPPAVTYDRKEEWQCRQVGCSGTRMRPYGLCWQHKHDEIMRKKED